MNDDISYFIRVNFIGLLYRILVMCFLRKNHVINVIKNVRVLKNSRQIEWVPRYQSDMDLDIFYKYF